MRIYLLTTGYEGTNAIEQATLHLAEALEKGGHETRLACWTRGQLAREVGDCDVLVVPYNPFMWGRWGLAPQFVRDIAGVRFRRPRARVALIVHEPYVPIRNWKSFLMGTWQRFQLMALLVMADRSFASIEQWASRMSRVRHTVHLPSGSNLPDARSERAAVRTELGLDDALVVATLSTGHPSHMTAYVDASFRRLAREGHDVIFLQLGAGASRVDVPAAFRVVKPGAVPSFRLGALVAAADLMLCPFMDGVSTRRTSFMAGLCQAVAVVGTIGALTDPMLLRQNLELVEIGNPSRFADRVATLSDDEEARAAAAAKGRRLFEAEFTWDTIAARLLAEIEL